MLLIPTAYCKAESYMCIAQNLKVQAMCLSESSVPITSAPQPERCICASMQLAVTASVPCMMFGSKRHSFNTCGLSQSMTMHSWMLHAISSCGNTVTLLPATACAQMRNRLSLRRGCSGRQPGCRCHAAPADPSGGAGVAQQGGRLPGGAGSCATIHHQMGTQQQDCTC